MPRSAASNSLDEILRKAIAPVIARVSVSIARAVAEMAAARIDEELKGGMARGNARKRRARTGAGSAQARTQSRTEITRWVADRHARRVPNFVIEITNGLDTKKRIVNKYGENAVFEKGKPPPKAR